MFNKTMFAGFALLLVISFSSCKKKEANPCATPSLDLTANGNGAVEIYVEGATNQGFFELEYGTNGFTKGSGTVVQINTNAEVPGLNNGTYDFYIRGNCGGTSYSDWSAAKTVLVTGGGSSSCSAPANLSVAGSSDNPYTFEWISGFASPDFYKLEYGPAGFAHGTGTIITTNSPTYSGGSFNTGTTYEYYVRAFCSASDSSGWSAAKSFYAAQNVNLCAGPTNVIITNQGGGQFVFSWTTNGAGHWEFTIVQHGAAIGSSTIYPSDQAFIQLSEAHGLYDFYVRTACSDGSKTAWVGPSYFSY